MRLLACTLSVGLAAPGDVEDLERLRASTTLLRETATGQPLTAAERAELIELHRLTLAKLVLVAARLRVSLTHELIRLELEDARHTGAPVPDTAEARLRALAPDLDALDDDALRAQHGALLAEIPPSLARVPAPPPPPSFETSIRPSEPNPVPSPLHASPISATSPRWPWITLVTTGAVISATGLALLGYGAAAQHLARERVGEEPSDAQMRWLDREVPRVQAALLGGGAAALVAGASLLAHGLVVRRSNAVRPRVQAVLDATQWGILLHGRF